MLATRISHAVSVEFSGSQISIGSSSIPINEERQEVEKGNRVSFTVFQYLSWRCRHARNAHFSRCQ